MPVYVLDGLVPRIPASAYVHPDAVVIGDVRLGEEASVWPGAVLRGDHGSITVGARTSIQDGSVLHTTEQWPTVIGDDCVVGHLVHVEGSVVESRCLVGSGSVVLNRSRIGAGSIVGAQALVPEDLQVPPGSMVLGVPARVRPLTDPETAKWVDYAVATYREGAARFHRGLQAYDPAVHQPLDRP